MMLAACAGVKAANNGTRRNNSRLESIDIHHSPGRAQAEFLGIHTIAGIENTNVSTRSRRRYSQVVTPENVHATRAIDRLSYMSTPLHAKVLILGSG
ncbi:MAG: hypothetical protein ABI135_07515, partial [Rhodoferax sp.]